MCQTLHRWFERILEVISITLLLSLAVVVVLAVVYRKAGSSLIWYDEVASVQLAWLTYYGAALAALKRAHLGFSGLFFSLPAHTRAVLFVVGESVVIGFFAVVGWGGWYLFDIFGSETLVSLQWVTLRFTQSVIPVGSALFVLAEFMSIPDAWRKARQGIDYEKLAIEDAIEEASRPS